jgi:uncharacterized protein
MTKPLTTSFDLGGIAVDPVALGSQGNAILGIRDSGKTVTATLLAEKLYEAGVPFVAFDPIGVWRFLRVPGQGRGIPVIVAGGQAGDLPLTPKTAPEIVRAAMKAGVSLVVDLYDMSLSKSDWKRIVADSVRVLLHENGPYGLRHVFLEEAAEFVPQRVVIDSSVVYAEIEKLARMGGNARLGYTLINQRAEEVNKAVLELCDNLFLHRQKGRHSIIALSKWLDAGAVVDHKAITNSLSTLPTGECWAWMAGTETPIRIHVPMKNSFHPDRRVMAGAAEAPKIQAVDAGEFVARMKALLGPQTSVKDGAPEPAAKTRKGASAAPGVDLVAIRREGHVEGYKAGHAEGYRIAVERMATQLRTVLADFGAKAAPEANIFLGHIGELGSKMEGAVVHVAAGHVAESRPSNGVLDNPTPVSARERLTPTISRPMQKILDALAWWRDIGIPTPARTQLAFLAGYRPNTGTFNTYLGALSSAGMISYPAPGRVALTGLGTGIAAKPIKTPTRKEFHDRVKAILDGPHCRLISALIERYPDAVTRDELASETGYRPGTGTFNTYLARLSTLDLITYPAPGRVRAADLLFPSGH